MHLGQDQLTGLHDLASLWWHIDREVARAERYGRELSLILLRVEGEPEEGAVRALGQLLERFLRTCDIAARAIDHEFVILLPETSEEGARACLQRLQLELALVVPAVQVRAGLAGREPGESGISLLAAASTRLERLR